MQRPVKRLKNKLWLDWNRFEQINSWYPDLHKKHAQRKPNRCIFILDMTPTLFHFWANFGSHFQDKMRQFWLAINERI